MSIDYASSSARDFPPPRCNEPRRFTSEGDDQSFSRVLELTVQKRSSISLSAFVLSSGSVLLASRSTVGTSAFTRTIPNNAQPTATRAQIDREDCIPFGDWKILHGRYVLNTGIVDKYIEAAEH